MRSLISPFGSHGDVHPLIGLGSALRERGHEVIFIVPGHFCPLLRQLGFEVVPLGDDNFYEQALNNPDLWHPRKAFPLVARGVNMASRLVYKVIADHNLPGQTLAIGGTLSFGVRIAGEKLGIPTVAVHLQPSILHSNIKTPVYPGLKTPRWWPVWLRRSLFELIYSKILDPALMPDLNAFRAELGLRPVRRVMMSWIHQSPLILGFFPEWFGPRQADWPPNVKLVGFPLFDERDATPMPADLEAFLNSGTPPIAFTPGSANVHGRDFFEAAVGACKILGKRGLLLTRFPEQIPPGLPDTVMHVPFAPFGLLLPRVAALVHHGGIGTAAQAMASAAPQLIMPLAHDQHDNADRMIRLGVARSIEPKKFQGPAVARELGMLMDSEEVKSRCQTVADLFKQNPHPMQSASELVERLASAWYEMKPQPA